MKEILVGFGSLGPVISFLELRGGNIWLVFDDLSGGFGIFPLVGGFVTLPALLQACKIATIVKIGSLILA